MLILGSEILANRIRIDPVLENNSWEMIVAVIKSGAANIPLTWYGSTKELVGTDNYTYHMRLVDKQAGRYNYTDSARTTNAVFLSDELIPTSYRINSTNSNVGGLAAKTILNTLNTTILNILPTNIQNLLEPVDIITNTGGGSYIGTATASSKIIMPSYAELFSTTETAYIDETKNGDTEFGLYDYFADNTAASFKIKIGQGATSASAWFIRSPSVSTSTSWYYVNASGSLGSMTTDAYAGIALCLAI